MKFCWLHPQNISQCYHFSLPSLPPSLGNTISNGVYCNGSPTTRLTASNRSLLAICSPCSSKKDLVKTCQITWLLCLKSPSGLPFHSEWTPNSFSRPTRLYPTWSPATCLPHLFNSSRTHPLHSISQHVIPEVVRLAACSARSCPPLSGITVFSQICVTHSPTSFKSQFRWHFLRDPPPLLFNNATSPLPHVLLTLTLFSL